MFDFCDFFQFLLLMVGSLMNAELFVKNIKTYCTLRGVKPTVACRESGAGTNLINTLERRGSIPSVEKVQLLAQYLGVTVSDLLGEEAEGKEKPTPEDGDGLDAKRRMFYERANKLAPENVERAIEYLDFLLSLQEKRDRG